MRTPFKQLSLATAIAVALGASGPASAVNLSDDNLGEVAIVPYYTVRDGLDTLISIVNTSSDYVVAVKLRFREGDNSRDARDFNIFLSPDDVWTGAVTMSEDGETPVVQTRDNTCTAPALSEEAATIDGFRGVPFTNIAYNGASEQFSADTGSDSIERTQEGYIEVIAMGVADPDESTIAAWAVHGNDGIPVDCGKIVATYTGQQRIDLDVDGDVFTPGICDENPNLPTNSIGESLDYATGNDAFKREFCEPLNVIKVAANLQAITAGASGGIPPTTLANFFNPFFSENPEFPSPLDLMVEPFSVDPNLNSAFPPFSEQTTNFGTITDFFNDPVTAGADAVSSLMMATSVVNEYGIGGAALAATDWVVTFPTKNFYTDLDTDDQFDDDDVRIAFPDPFENFFQNDGDGDGRSCVTVNFGYFDREERLNVPTGDLDFSPKPGGTPPSSICQEVQTISFAESSVLNSRNNYGVPLADGFENGWMRLIFSDATAITGEAVEYAGLPVLGFSIKLLRNAVVQEGVLRNFAIVSEHAYVREFLAPSGE
jgi:hypothetical protein